MADTQVKTTRRVLDLNDPEFFCNKSWTISFNLNTKSWISFHSYLPNFYIGENNYFSSGLNGCCDEFDFVAGTIVPTPSTTTTTTIAPSTTTTTTTLFTGCNLSGNVVLTYCDISGTGIITSPPACKRPPGLEEFSLITGYTELPSNIHVDSTGSDTEACNAITFINDQPDIDDPTYETTSYLGYTTSIAVGNTVYLEPGTNCLVVPNGWYFLEEDLEIGRIFLIVNGKVALLQFCNPTTTTTTTESPELICNTYTATKATAGSVNINYLDCDGIAQVETVGNVGGGLSTKTFCASSIVGITGDVTITYNGPC